MCRDQKGPPPHEADGPDGCHMRTALEQLEFNCPVKQTLLREDFSKEILHCNPGSLVGLFIVGGAL